MSTPPILILRVPTILADPNNPDCWRQFLDDFERSLYAYFTSKGLQDADARDLIQITLIKVIGVARAERFDPARGAFAAYLSRIARNNLLDFFRSRSSRMRGVGGDEDRLLLEEVPDRGEDEISRRERHEHNAARARKVRAAAHSLRSRVPRKEWVAFWRTCVENEPVARVARELRMKELKVYRSKYRIAPMIREIVRKGDRD
jgi:RNA polymerase sigma-70 factor (ECF subfamily)